MAVKDPAPKVRSIPSRSRCPASIEVDDVTHVCILPKHEDVDQHIGSADRNGFVSWRDKPPRLVVMTKYDGRSVQISRDPSAGYLDVSTDNGSGYEVRLHDQAGRMAILPEVSNKIRITVV